MCCATTCSIGQGREEIARIIAKAICRLNQLHLRLAELTLLASVFFGRIMENILDNGIECTDNLSSVDEVLDRSFKLDSARYSLY
jgi:hypothetical protein